MQPRRFLGWVAGAVVAAVAILSPRFASSQPEPEVRKAGAGVCASVIPERLPAFTASGSWTKAGDLVLLDNLGKTLVRLSPQGRTVDARLPSSFASYLARWYPVAMARHGDGYLIQVAGNRFASFDRRYVRDRVYSVNAASGGRPVVDKVFSWTATASDIYAVADVKMGENQWWSGFVRFPLSNPGAVELVEPIDDEERVFYRLSLSYLTTTEQGIPYVLRMSNQMGLYRFERNADGTTRLEPLRSFEALYPHPSFRPELPLLKNANDAVTVMREVELSRMPVGVYGGQGLYVLSRRPVGRTTEWSVSRLAVDGGRDRLLWTAPLAGSSREANHISVVPGPDQFAFIQKGPVRGMTVQSVERVLLVPTSRMKLDRLQGKLCG